MKMRTLFAASIVNSMIMYSAFATMPDEINFKPYKLEYNQLSAQADVVSDNLEEVKDELNTAYSNESSIEYSIENLEESSDELVVEIEELEELRSDLDEESSDLEFRVQTLSGKLQNIERKKQNVNRQIDQENIRLNPLRQKVSKVKGLVSEKRDQKVSAKKRYESKLSRSQKLTSEFNKLKEQENNLQTKLNNLIAQMTGLQGKIQETQGALSSINPKIETAKADVESQRAKKRELAKVVKKYQEEQTTLQQNDPASPRIAELNVLITHAQSAVDAQVKVLKASRKNLKDLKATRDQLKGELASLESQQTTLPVTISETQTQYQAASQAADSKQSQMAVAVSETNNAKKHFDKMTGELKRLTQRLETLSTKLKRESVQLAELQEERTRLNNRVTEVSRKLRGKRQELNRVNSRLAEVEREIPSAQRELRGMYSEIDGLENDLTVVRGQIVSLNQNVGRLSSDLRMAEGRRDSKYQEYLSRYNYYNEKLSEAKEIGNSQTDVAHDIAAEDSNQYLASRSSELSKSMGSELATSQAKLYSSVRSEIKGYEDGYVIGHASEVDQERGRSEGEAAGIREARFYANSVLKPQYFNDIFASTISNSAAKVKSFVMAPTEELKVNHQVDEVKSLFGSYASVNELTRAEIEKSNELETGLDNSIAKFKQNNNQVLSKYRSLSVPANVYDDVNEIPYQDVDCSTVYKNVQDYINACEQTYSANFKSKYVSTHYENFENQYQSLFAEKTEDQRNSLIESEYSKYYASFYPVAKDSGIADGKEDIYQETFKVARANAYKAELPSADQNALNTAKVEVTNWINDNATLTIKGSSLQSSTFRAGDRANVQLSVKNLSPQALKSPAKVVITGSSNAVVNQREFYLKSANGYATTQFKDAIFTVHPDAKSGDRVQINGKIILSGGKYKAQREETFSATAVASLNPSVSAQLKYDSSPKVLTTWRRRIIIHKLEGSLTPRIESVKSGYSVSIKALPGSEEYIKFKNTSAGTNRLNYGQSGKVTFKYTFKKKSRGKRVKVQMDYTYKGRVIKSEVLELRPH